MNREEFLKYLFETIAKVFDNEDKFMREFDLEKFGFEVMNFYMGSAKCEVTVLGYNNAQQIHYVGTKEVLDWLESV